MTASQWFDLAVIAVAFTFAVSGWRSGALGSLLSFVGVALGGVAGLLLAPHIIEHISGQRTRLFIWVFLVLALVVIGVVAGAVLGRAARSAIRNAALRTVDSVIGALLMVGAALIVAWLVATPLRASDQPALAQAFQGSMIRKQVDQIAPSWLRTVPNRLSALLNTSGITDGWHPFGQTPIAPVDAPDANLANSAVVTKTRPSVVKIRGLANGCQKVLEGTGFVIKPGRVMSNAHVVAGADSVTVESDGTTYDAKVISYDPNADISILEVPDLQAPELSFIDGDVPPGTDAVVLGYPGGGEFVATPARIRETITLTGPDIYQKTTVNRNVFTIRGTVRQGDSGGPLIDLDGRVLGVVFGAAVDDPDTGFVLTANEVARQMEKVDGTEPVATGPCIT